MSRYFGHDVLSFLDLPIAYVQRMCIQHTQEKEQDRIATWNMMQGKPPEITQHRVDDDAPPEKIDEDEKNRMMQEASALMTRQPTPPQQQQRKPKRVRVR